MENESECYSCQAMRGERRLSPGPVIYRGNFWHIEHAYPCGMVGWLVLVLNRHAATLHELSEAEFEELATLQYKTVQILHRKTDSLKEYTMCFAEAPHFNHIHFHIVARLKDAPDSLKGTGIFSMIRPDVTPVSPQLIEQFCIELSQEF